MSAALALIQQAQAHFGAGRREQAKAVMLQAAERFPDDPEVLFGVSQLMRSLGDLPAAALYAERLVAAAPGHPDAWLQFAQVCIAQGNLEKAEGYAMRALELDPRNADRHRSVSWVTHRRTRYLEAARYARRGLALAPHDADLRQKEAVALQALGRAEASAAAYREGIAACPDSLDLAEGYASCLNYLPGAEATETLAAHRRFGAILARGQTAPRARAISTADRARPPRIGILSTDLRTHSVGFFMRALLAHHDHQRQPLHCYSVTRAEDDFTNLLRAGMPKGRWRTFVGTEGGPQAIAEAICGDGIDILIELSGLTREHQLRVLLSRPAPIQMTYCGYPNTTGMNVVDYRLVDSLTDPAPEADRWCVEKLVRLDPCLLCFTPPSERVAGRERRGEGPVVFGSFNALMKLNDAVLRTWAALLQRVPGSKLLIKAFGLQDPQVHDDVRARVLAAGIDAERVELLAPAKGTGDHLLTYQRVDIALDTFPYHGTTTTCEALYMGVPVVTRAGNTHGSRVGVSLLSALGLGELIASSEEDFIERCATLAGDAARRAALGADLRGRLLASPLCDGPAFARCFDNAMDRVWAEHQPR